MHTVLRRSVAGQVGASPLDGYATDGKLAQRISAPATPVTNLVLPDPTSTALTISSMKWLLVRLHTDQHRQCDTTRPRAMPAERGPFRLQSRRRFNRPALQRETTGQLRRRIDDSDACVTPRSHPIGGRQPHAEAPRHGGRRQRRNRSSTPSGARGSAAVCQPPGQKHRSAPFATLNRPQRRVAARQPPPSTSGPARRLRPCPLTPKTDPSSTTHSRGRPQPPALCSKEASQSLPALEVPALSRCGPPPWRWWPRGCLS